MYHKKKHKFKVGDFVMLATGETGFDDEPSVSYYAPELSKGSVVKISSLKKHYFDEPVYEFVEIGTNSRNGFLVVAESELKSPHGYQSPLWKVLNGEEI